jgi:hypothetical protein
MGALLEGMKSNKAASPSFLAAVHAIIARVVSERCHARVIGSSGSDALPQCASPDSPLRCAIQEELLLPGGRRWRCVQTVQR